MIKLFKILWNIGRSFRLKSLEAPLFVKNPVAQEDQKTKDAINHVVESFEQQQERIDIMAQKPHDPTCKDTFTCKKKVCFIWEPDVIVSEKIVVTSKKKTKKTKAV